MKFMPKQDKVLISMVRGLSGRGARYEEYIMGSIKQNSRVIKRRSRLRKHKNSVLGISGVILLLVAVVSVSSISLRAKNESYMEQEAELEAQIQEEEERTKEIEQMEEYVGTDEYIEQTARDKLGLIYENEIIFKRK